MSNTGSIRRVHAAGIIIFRILNKKAEYLLLQASNLRHHWTPPKGHVEAGETNIIAAKREVQEEAGLHPHDYDIIDGFTSVLMYEAWDKQKTVTYWTARVKNPDVAISISSEHMAYRWCDLPTALKISEYENLREAYRNCETLITEKFPVQER